MKQDQIDICVVPRWIHYKSQLDNLKFADFVHQAKNDEIGVLLDVRTQSEFNSGTLKGAINIDYLSPTLADEIEKLDRAKHYYIFCRTSRRSLRVCMLMKNTGFRIYNLDEGLKHQLESGNI